MHIKIITKKDIDDEFIRQWVQLFSICFNKNQVYAAELYRKKYKHETNVVFSVLEERGALTACYSGIILDGVGGKVFLSMDTMTLKTIKHGTTKVALPLYEFLTQIGVLAVVGFPNSQIVKIREKFLGWQLVGQLHVYIGILIKPKNRNIRNPDLWQLNRKNEGFYNDNYSTFANLYCKNKRYKTKWYKPYIALETVKPGPFFLKMPNFLGLNKRFGYRILNDLNTEWTTEGLLRKCAEELDVECIDVP